MNDKMFPALDVSDINGLESYRIMSDRESIHNATWQRLGGGISRFVWNKYRHWPYFDCSNCATTNESLCCHGKR